MTHKKKTPKTAPTPPENARHLTTERLHDLARKWKRAQSAERAVALFTYSPEHGVQYAVFGSDEHLSITSEDTAAQKSANFWQRLRTWLLPFNIER